MLVARGLAKARLRRAPDSLLVIDAGHAPENRTAELRRFAADLVLLIDAAELGEEPGGIRRVEIDEIDGMSASTHTLPLSMLAKYLTLELGCEIYILGIQPRSTAFDGLVSAEVIQAVQEIVEELAKSLSVFPAQEITCLN